MIVKECVTCFVKLLNECLSDLSSLVRHVNDWEYGSFFDI